jgi:hypothetical protein
MSVSLKRKKRNNSLKNKKPSLKQLTKSKQKLVEGKPLAMTISSC